ncbi:hypothetical protein FRC11_014010 [Ceratobasidium sp. 423]|nr:hypothetical protein FRC11_014010 [Ceratobasidium sp. 423]
MRSFAANEAHTVKPRRCRADADGAPVTNTITEGMRQLVHGAGGTIAKSNRAFAQFQSSLGSCGYNSKSEDENENKDERMAEDGTYCSDPEPGAEGQDEQSGSESGAGMSESKESEGEEFWEDAFNLEFEFGEEAFNAFGDMNVSDEEEAFEYDKLDDDTDSLIEEL